MRARLANPAPHVTILDPRLTLRLAAELAGRFRLSNHVQAEPLAAALHYRAALALTAWSERLVSASDSCGIELHRIPRPK